MKLIKAPDEFLEKKVNDFDFTKMDVSDYVESLEHTSFTSRELYNACQLFKQMNEDENCTIILTIAGSTQAAGCLQLYRDLVKLNMVDIIVATGASIIDMDLYEALGYHHYKGTTKVDDDELRQKGIDRIYDTYIHEEDLKKVRCEGQCRSNRSRSPKKVASG